MAMSPVIKVFLVICGFLSIVFLVIGIYSPAWLKYEIRTYSHYSSTTVSVSIGLWRTTACSESNCASISMNKLVQAIEDSNKSSDSKNAATSLLKSFLPMQVLCVLGGIAALIGASLVFTYIKQIRIGNGNKQMAVAGVVLSTISGILVISAVALQSERNQSFKDEVDAVMKIPDVRQTIEMEVLSPWAILMSGIGAGLIFLLGLVFGIVLYVYRNDESGPPPTSTTNQSPYAVYNVGAK